MTMTAMMNHSIELTDEETMLVHGGAARTQAQYHTIRRGETLTRIAHRFGTTVKKLMDLNPQITDPNKIYAGASLRIS